MRLNRMTRILVGVLALLIAYFYLVEEKHRKADEEKTKAERKVLSYEPDSVERFVLINPDSERIDIARSGAGWRITAPVVAAGDAPTIGAFLRQVVPGRKTEELRDVPDLATYGLRKPFATVVLFHRGGPPDTLHVGDKTPTSSNTYMRLGSSRNVFISSETTHNVMQKKLYHLRDKSFISFKGESVNALTVRSGTSRLELTRSGKYWWFMRPRARADRAKVEQYLTKLTTTIVRAFAREDTGDLAPYGLSKPDREITLARGAEKTTVSFGTKENDQVYATRTGLDKVTLLDGKLLEAFDWNTESLRARNLAFFDGDSVSALRYETPDTSIVLRKTGNKWARAGADTIAAAKSYIVDALVRKLTTVTFDKIVADPLLPGDRRLEKWALRVTLENIVGGAIDQVTIAEPSTGTEVGTSRSANVLGTLKKGTLKQIDDIFMRIGSRSGTVLP